MGPCPSRKASAVVRELKDVTLMLRELILKYEKERKTNEVALRQALLNGNRTHQLIALRKRKTLDFYIDGASRRLHTITEKQYAVEQLSVTKLHLDAMQHTSQIFKIFARKNSVDKVERLCDTLSDLTDRVLEVDELLQEPLDLDDATLAEELREIELEGMPEAPVTKPEPEPVRELEIVAV